MSKCKWCGKEFERDDRSVYCSPACHYEYRKAVTCCESFIKTVAEKYNFEVNKQTRDRIIKAKIMFFKGENLKLCPCDSQNPERFCGSARCIADVVYKGKCHCNLYLSKNKPLLDNSED